MSTNVQAKTLKVDRRTTTELLPSSIVQYRYRLNRFRAEIAAHEFQSSLSEKRLAWLRKQVDNLAAKVEA